MTDRRTQDPVTEADDAYAQGREDERKAIVTWLRDACEHDERHPSWSYVVQLERGAHLEELSHDDA